MNILANHYISICVALMVITLVFIHFNLKDSNANKYIALALLGVDLLPASMAVSWATTQGEGLNTALFVVGFIAFASLKLLLVWLLLRAMKDNNGAGVFLVIISMVVIYMVVLAAAAFNGNVSGAKKVAQETLISAPIKSLDAKIATAENRLTGLARFSDTHKAASESIRVAALNTQLAGARAALSRCPSNYLTKCINPNQAKIDTIQRQLEGLTYHKGNEEYAGTLKLLSDLQERRTTLLSGNDHVSVSGLGADDRFLAKLFDGDVEQARNWKTLIFMIVFDFLTILIRMVVAYVNKGVNEGERLADQVMLLAGMGHSANQIISIMATNAGLSQLPDRSTQNTTSQEPLQAPTGGTSQALSDDLESLYIKWSDLVKTGQLKCSQDPSKKFILKELSKGGLKHGVTPIGAVSIHKEWLDRGTSERWLKPLGGIGKPSHALT
jgi:hypothetical protein